LRKFSVSKPAQSDMRVILKYTFEQWGKEQAVRYAQGLQDCFQVLAESPEAGRACDEISKHLRRHEHGKHVVFYLLNQTGIRIVRVLHGQMVPVKSQFEQ